MRARRSLSFLGLAVATVLAAACGTVDIEVTGETDVGKIECRPRCRPTIRR